MRAQVVVVVAAEVRCGIAGQERIHRSRLVRPGDVPRPGHGDSVAEPGPALRGDQVVPAVLAVQVGALQAAAVAAAAIDPLGRPDEPTLLGVELLQDDRARVLVAVPRIPFQRDDPVPAVVVVQERRVEPDAGQVHRLAPRPGQLGGGDHVVVDVEQVRRGAVDHGVRQVEQAGSAVVGQVRRPDPGVEIQTAQVVDARVEHMSDQRPGGEVRGVEQPHPGLPDERGGGDVVVRADPQDRWIRVEPGQHRVADHGVSQPFSLAGRARTDTRRPCMLRTAAAREVTRRDAPSA